MTEHTELESGGRYTDDGHGLTVHEVGVEYIIVEYDTPSYEGPKTMDKAAGQARFAPL